VVLCGWDFSRRAKSGRPSEVLSSLAGLSAGALALTRLFVTPRPLHLGCAPRSAADCAAARHAAAQLGWAAPEDREAQAPARVAAAAWAAAGAETVLGLDLCAETALLAGEDVFAGGLLQAGVLRSNCIDCLDRTNVAQFAHGCAALGLQLLALGLADSCALPQEAPCVEALSQLYQSMGDALAQQYGGSQAHNPVLAAAAQQQQQQKAQSAAQPSEPPAPAGPPSAWRAAGGYSRELLTSVRRFYSATVTDAEKQDAINLFLGHFVPRRGRPQLWELDSDVWMHTLTGARLSGAADGGDWAAQEEEGASKRIAARRRVGADETPAEPPAAGDAAPPPSPPQGLSWQAWERRRSPFGRRQASEPATPGLASFDSWGEASEAPPVRIYAPGCPGGYTCAAPGLEQRQATLGEAQARRAEAAAASSAAQRLRSERAAQRLAASTAAAAACVARSGPQPGRGLGLRDAAEQRSAFERYERVATEREPWAQLFRGQRQAQAEAARAMTEASLDELGLLAWERERDRELRREPLPPQSPDRLRRPGTRPASPQAAREATLAAAAAWLAQPDERAPTPDWLRRPLAAAQAALSSASAAPTAETALRSPSPLCSPEEQKPARSALAALPFPPSPGPELRIWLRSRGDAARAECEASRLALSQLAALSPGVLGQRACPPAANVHAMARCQMALLSEEPAWPKLPYRPQPVTPPPVQRVRPALPRQPSLPSATLGGRVNPTPRAAGAATGWAASFSPSPALRAALQPAAYTTPPRLAAVGLTAFTPIAPEHRPGLLASFAKLRD